MVDERLTRAALQLQKIGVSLASTSELLAHYPLEVIERQLQYLPYRKARRPAAFVVETIRGDYSAPKEFYYAQTQAQPASADTVDQSAERCDR